MTKEKSNPHHLISDKTDKDYKTSKKGIKDAVQRRPDKVKKGQSKVSKKVKLTNQSHLVQDTSRQSNYIQSRKTSRLGNRIIQKDVNENGDKQSERVRPKKSVGLGERVTQRAKFEMGRVIDDMVAQEDNLSELSDLNQKVRSVRYTVRRVANTTQPLKNRIQSKQMHFEKPSSKRLKGATKAKVKPYRKKVNRPKKTSQAISKAGKTAGQTIGKASKLLLRLAVQSGPVGWIVIIGLLFLVIIMGLFGQSVAIQDEYNLNEMYLYQTKLDREKSSDTVDYWTNWEDPLLYINFKYDAIHDGQKLDPNYNFMDQHAGKQYITTLWDDLNKDPVSLKSMEDLYTNKETRYYLEKDDLEDYKELLSIKDEVGKFASILDLDNPFYKSDDSKADNPLKISKRFGYTSKDEKYDRTILEVGTGQTLYATMDGIVEIQDKNVTIKTKDAKFTYYDVAEVRLNTGDAVKAGDVIGKTSSASGQEIAYQKQLEYTPKSTLTNFNPKPVKEWFYVNPGFYFRSVSYLQTTTIKAADVNEDMAQRALAIYNYFKKHVPGMTVKGLSAALGNWEIENSINPKRAEGDYLNPPIGATATSWDDPAWLSMSGPQIYGGIYPNIIHRGIGMGQFTDTADGSRRHTMLLDYAKSKGKKWYDLELQLDFMLNGDSPNYQAHLRRTLTATDNTSAWWADYFLVYWEGNPGNKLAARQAAAQKWESYLNQALTGGGQIGASSATLPPEYQGKLSWPTFSAQAVTPGMGYPGNAYALGNCTWYIYNRFYQLGKQIYPYLGNAGNWPTSAIAQGYAVSTTPQAGTAVAFSPGVAAAHPIYGHVAFVEYVNADGSFLISEMNGAGLYTMSYRTLSYQPGMYFIKP